MDTYPRDKHVEILSKPQVCFVELRVWIYFKNKNEYDTLCQSSVFFCRARCKNNSRIQRILSRRLSTERLICEIWNTHSRSLPFPFRMLYRLQLNWRTLISLGRQLYLTLSRSGVHAIRLISRNECKPANFSFSFFSFFFISGFLSIHRRYKHYASISDFRIYFPLPLSIYIPLFTRNLSLNTKTIHLFFF